MRAASKNSSSQEPSLPLDRGNNVFGLENLPDPLPSGAGKCGPFPASNALDAKSLCERSDRMGRHPAKSSGVDCSRGARGYLEAARTDLRAIRVSEKVCGQISGFCAAGRGTTIQRTCVRRTVTGTSLTTGTTTLGSVVPGMWSESPCAFVGESRSDHGYCGSAILYFRTTHLTLEAVRSGVKQKTSPRSCCSVNAKLGRGEPL